MLSFAVPVQVEKEGAPLIDIVGTGGDGKDAFNVSTAAAFVVAACGVRVAKHGNRSSSGNCGSSDFLEQLGCHIRLGAAHVEKILADSGHSFLFAPMFHPAMQNVAPVRKQIGVRTVFNLLGPLTNPARPSRLVRCLQRVLLATDAKPGSGRSKQHHRQGLCKGSLSQIKLGPCLDRRV